MAAAKILHLDAPLAARLQAALKDTPQLPVVAATAVASPSALAQSGDKVIAASHDPASPYRNGENIGLEPVWPYELIGLDDPLFAIARRTYALRPFVYQADWSYDPIQAARLGLGSDVADGLFQLAQLYQVYPNGMSELIQGPPNEFYLEHSAIVALTLSEVLAIQDDDGLVRIGPAIPPGWTMSGTVTLRNGATVDVDAVNGALSAFTLHVDGRASLRVVTPWKGRRVQMIERGSVVKTFDGGRFEVDAHAGDVYRFQLVGDASEPHFDAGPEATVKSLGRASIGLTPPCCAAPAGYDMQADRPLRP